MEICESLECEVRNYTLRHPKVYSFFRDYNYCKFAGFCSFSHSIRNHSNDALKKEIEDIKKKLKLLKEKEMENENKIMKLEKEINEKENLIQNEFANFEEQLKLLRKQLQLLPFLTFFVI